MLLRPTLTKVVCKCARNGGAGGRALSSHATVLVMRHDVIWKNDLHPLRADRSVRLWLPFDCGKASCRDRASRAGDIYAESAPPPRASCEARLPSAASNWTLLQYKTNVLGVNCGSPRKISSERARPQTERGSFATAVTARR